LEPKVNEISGACHKRFRTEDQAQAFIEDWKKSFAAVYHAAMMEALDKGFRPSDLKLSVEGILYKTETKSEGTDDLDELKLEQLNLEEK
jgi:hypothetical protein